MIVTQYLMQKDIIKNVLQGLKSHLDPNLIITKLPEVRSSGQNLDLW